MKFILKININILGINLILLLLKKNGKINFNFLNQFYGIISIFNEGKYLSSSIQNLINLSNEQNNFLIYNTSNQLFIKSIS